MIVINDKIFKKLAQALNEYDAEIAPHDRWKKLNNDEKMWREFVGPVAGVGNVRQSDKLTDAMLTKNNPLKYEDLVKLSQSKQQIFINKVFREYGIRYASPDYHKCAKSKALTYNLNVLIAKGGPCQYIRNLSNMQNSYDRVLTIQHHFKYMKSKVSRSILMNLGMIEDYVLFDIRILNILKSLGALPKGNSFISKEFTYRENELIMLDKVCRPLEISGVVLSRVLFEHADDIL